jgi:hypothetical protein
MAKSVSDNRTINKLIIELNNKLLRQQGLSNAWTKPDSQQYTNIPQPTKTYAELYRFYYNKSSPGWNDT